VRLTGYKPVRKQSLLGRLFADKDEAPPRGLYVHGESRARQDHADGPVFSAESGQAQAPCAFPRIHGRGARADLRLPAEHRARRDRRRRCDRAHRGVDFDEAWLLCFDEFHVTTSPTR